MKMEVLRCHKTLAEYTNQSVPGLRWSLSQTVGRVRTRLINIYTTLDSAAEGLCMFFYCFKRLMLLCLASR